ncbi:MAG: N-acetylmuramoyl-L-alanine amidase [Wujia sp.]
MKHHRMIKSILIMLALIMLCGCGSKEKIKDSAEGEATPTDASAITEEQVTGQDVASVAVTDERTKDEDGFYILDDYVMVTAEIINIRTKPSTDAPVYMMLEMGNVIKRTGENGEWTRVNIDGSSFYAYSEFVQETEPPVAEEPETPEDTYEATGTDTEQQSTKIIVIDPGNQASANFSVEAIGPSTDVTKQCATVGNVGTTLGTKEYALNLEYATLLKQELEKRGYKVVLTRESNNVDISNKSRALVASTNSADILIRIQMNYSTNAELTGAMAICMTSTSQYNSNLYSDSKTLSTRLLQGLIAATGSDNHGVYETDAMTFINWSEVPVAIVKIGFLSNTDEEATLISDEYKQKVVTGLADGVDYYFAK